MVLGGLLFSTMASSFVSLWPVETSGDLTVSQFLESPLVQWVCKGFFVMKTYCSTVCVCLFKQALSLSGGRDDAAREDDAEESSIVSPGRDLCNCRFLQDLLGQM